MLCDGLLDPDSIGLPCPFNHTRHERHRGFNSDFSLILCASVVNSVGFRKGRSTQHPDLLLVYYPAPGLPTPAGIDVSVPKAVGFAKRASSE
jgi:hypothetical protein